MGNSVLDSRLMPFRSGNAETAGTLIERFYPELRRLAHAQMRLEGKHHTWQPTVLVHELYLELTRIKALPPGGSDSEREKQEFFRLAAFLMRRLLLHHSRPHRKRLETGSLANIAEPGTSGEESLREVEDLLDRLERIDGKLRAVVEMKAFEGLSREEISQRLGCSVRTVARHWDFAQCWLRSTLTSE